MLLGLFDESVSDDEKRNMVKNIKEVDGEEDLPFRVWITESADKTLADFCTSNSLKLFDILELPKEFLDVDPCQWNGNQDCASQSFG